MDETHELTPAGERILDAASALFYQRGIHTVGVALVAESAGVTKKTLYDCFGSKDALVTRYLQHRDERWWTYLEERLARERSPLTVFDAYLDHPDIDPRRGCAYLNAAAELPAEHPGMAVIRAHKRAVRDHLVDLVVESGGDEDLGELLFLAAEGASAHQRVGDDERVRAARRLAADRLARVDRDGSQLSS